jgi:hypothetical protein
MEPSMTTAKGLQTTWFMRLMQAVSATRLVSEKVRGGRESWILREGGGGGYLGEIR